jgi:hypothetical protein
LAKEVGEVSIDKALNGTTRTLHAARCTLYPVPCTLYPGTEMPDQRPRIRLTSLSHGAG